MIRYTELTENNREAFRGYISEDIFSRLSGQGVKAIGALEETDKGETISAGALVFTVKEEEQEIAASVQWLYVGASYRGQGIADGLMERMFDVLSFLGDYRLTCNIPETLEFDEVLLFFRSWGFDFDRTELFEYSLSIKDILRSPFLEKEIDTSDIAPLTEVRGEEWQRLRKRVKERLKSKDGDRKRLLSFLETDLEELDLFAKALTSCFKGFGMAEHKAYVEYTGYHKSPTTGISQSAHHYIYIWDDRFIFSKKAKADIKKIEAKMPKIKKEDGPEEKPENPKTWE